MKRKPHGSLLVGVGPWVGGALVAIFAPGDWKALSLLVLPVYWILIARD